MPIYLCDDPTYIGVEMIQEVKGQVAGLGMAGNARVGKSWLACYLQGRPHSFKSSNGLPCTKGASVAAEAMSFHQLASTWGLPTPRSQGTRALFIDFEGQGDKDTTYDFKLLAPLALTCLVLVFNVKGYVEPNTLLMTLEALHLLAQYLMPEISQGGRPIFGYCEYYSQCVDRYLPTQSQLSLLSVLSSYIRPCPCCSISTLGLTD